MSKQRDVLRESFREGAPASMRASEKKRKAPDPGKTKADSALEARDKSISRGVRKSWRLHPDTPPAVERAAQRYNVTQRDLVDFLLRAGLAMLASGKIKLPVKPDEATYTIEPPDIPADFSG